MPSQIRPLPAPLNFLTKEQRSTLASALFKWGRGGGKMKKNYLRHREVFSSLFSDSIAAIITAECISTQTGCSASGATTKFNGCI